MLSTAQSYRRLSAADLDAQLLDPFAADSILDAVWFAAHPGYRERLRPARRCEIEKFELPPSSAVIVRRSNQGPWLREFWIPVTDEPLRASQQTGVLGKLLAAVLHVLQRDNRGAA